MKYFRLRTIDEMSFKIEDVYDSPAPNDMDSIVVSEEELERLNPKAIVNIDEYTRRR